MNKIVLVFVTNFFCFSSLHKHINLVTDLINIVSVQNIKTGSYKIETQKKYFKSIFRYIHSKT